MPLSFQFSLSQTKEVIIAEIKVPVGVLPQMLSVTVTDLCITVSAPESYILNIDLSDHIQLQDACCKFIEGHLKIQVTKVKPELWDNIQFNGNKDLALKRREESYERYDEYCREQHKKEVEAQANEKRRQIDADIEARQRQAAEERRKREQQILSFQQQVADYQEACPSTVSSGEAIIPEVRTDNTVTIEATFTKRRIAVPAREGRDIYADKQLGPVVEAKSQKAPDEQDIKEGEHKRKLSPYELLDQATKLASRGIGADFPTAMELAGQVKERLPLNMDAIVLYASLSLRQGRYEQVLESTDAGITILEGKHPLQKNKELQIYSKELQSTVYALHGAALAQAKRLREAFSYMEMASKLTPDNEGLVRDTLLLQRIVEILD